ncbi:MAG: type II secretion system protein M [Pseudomonadota bacterium]
MTIVNNARQAWQNLQKREQLVLAGGAVAIVLIVAYAFVWQPWQAALHHMETVLPNKRVELVWMRQQAAAIQQGGARQVRQVRGANQSLMAVIEQTARAGGIKDAIQQMVPRQNNQEVSVVLEGASFNQWVRWVDTLQQQYAVSIKQLTADREPEKPDTAEIRVTFMRNG